MFPALDRARPRDNRQLLAADCCIARADNGLVRLEIERDELVRFGDSNCFEHTGQMLEAGRIECARIAGDADRGPRRAGHDVRAKAEFLDDLHDAIDLALRGAAFHYNQHGNHCIIARLAQSQLSWCWHDDESQLKESCRTFEAPDGGG